MPHARSAVATLLLAALAFGGVARVAFAQASFSESFDAAGSVQAGQAGPSSLISRGWTFRKQASPAGEGVWYPMSVYPYEGAACLYVDSSVTQVGGSGALWAILPAIPGQRAGDPVSFWSTQGSSTAGSPTGRLQVRYSPGGGITTGSGSAGTGDFSQVLLDIPGSPSGVVWTQYTALVPGTGRLALRFYQPASGSGFDYASNFRVDSLRVGAADLGVPFPAPGQTVHWTGAMSPVNLPEQHLVIPQGGTVIVDPGVVVNISPTYRLDVRGSLEMHAGSTITIPASDFPPSEVNVYGTATLLGTQASPVRVLGGPRDWAATTERFGAMPGGRITASHVDLQSTFSALNSGVVVADHVNASGDYAGFFTSGQVYTTGGTIAVRDSSLSNGAWININGGYLLLDRTTLDNAQLYTGRYRGGQTLYLNNLTARNHPDSCFRLTGYDHFFGPGNVISGNGFPVHLYGAGISPGSTLPASGNANNMVHGGIGTVVGVTTFANVGIPYRIDRDDSMPDNMGGSLLIEPGVTVKMGPGAYIPANFGSALNVEGLPESPIVFERLSSAQSWVDLWFAVSHVRPKVEHCIFRGADRAIDADESIVRVESCLFENNGIGVNVRNYGVMIPRKSRFFGNGVGAQSSYGSPASGFGHGFIDAEITDGKPNWFQGNGAGLSTLNPNGDTDDARGNYWGSPSGPTDPTNPGGTGDATPGANLVVPFEAAEPDVGDHPPIVRLLPHSFLIEEGDRIMLHWNARDEGFISKFQVWFSSHGDNPGLSLLVDNIPGSARSWEITVPTAVPASNYPDPSAIRVVAFDERGQQGFDDIIFRDPWLHDVSERIHAGSMPALVRPGEPMTVCLAPGESYFDAILTLDADHQSYSLGGTTTNCLSGTSSAPPVSTDLARVIVWRGGAGGRDLFEFSDYFSIRPDPAIGDAPPVVQMTSPAPGQSFPGGSGVPIAWSASDDEALREFEIHASYNAGRTWHTIAQNLPPTARAYTWDLPPSEGIPQLRLRVVARDLRFQNSSSGGDRALSILPGVGPAPCDPDFNQDGNTDQDDLAYLIDVVAGGDNPTGTNPDFNRDGNVDQDDVAALLDVIAGGGCP